MTKGLALAMFLTVMAFGIHLQLQIETIKGSTSGVTTFNDASGEQGQITASVGGGRFINADDGFEPSDARVPFSAGATATQYAEKPSKLRIVSSDAYVNPDLPPIASGDNEARNIGEQISEDDISAYENFDAEALSIGAFVDADSPYR